MIFIPFIMLLPVFLYAIYHYRKSGNSIPVLLIGLYFFGAICTVFTPVDEWYPFYSERSITIQNMFIYPMVLIPFLLCSFYIKPVDIAFEKENSIFSIIIFVFFIFLGLYSFLYQLPYAVAAILLGAENVREQQNLVGEFILPKNIFTTIAVAISYFYFFFIIGYFLAIVQNRSLLIKSFMLICSLSYIVSGLTFGTRDVFFNYLITFLFSFLYFKNSLPKIQVISIKRKIYLFFSLAVFAVGLISYDRFAERNMENSIAYGTVGYFGQQPYVFSVTIEEHTDFYNGDLRFPVFKNLIFGETRDIQRKQLYETNFGTFIKDLYAEGGWPFLILAALLFPLTCHFLYVFNPSYLFSNKLILDVYIFQFLSSGFFYYMLGTRAGNIYFIILSLVFLVNLIISGLLGGRKLKF